MATASRTVVVTVDTQHGSKPEARDVLHDVLRNLRTTHHDEHVGMVRVHVHKASPRG